MTNFDNFKITSSEFLQYSKYQKNIFFSKSDSNFAKNKIIPDTYIKKICLKYFKKNPKEVSLLSKNLFHTVFKINFINKSYVIRFNNRAEKHKDLSFYIENFIIQKIKIHKISKLEIHAIDVSRSLIPFDYEIVSNFSGKSFFDISHKRKITDKESVAFGEIVGKLHKVKTNKFGLINVKKIFKNNSLEGIDKNWKDYLTKQLSAHLSYCHKHKIISLKEKRIIEKLFKLSIPKITVTQPVLLHGDLANHNVLIKSGKVSLVDWEDALSGDPVFDIAYYGTGAELHKEWLSNFLKGYKKIQKLPNDFEMRYWLYFLRISLSKAVSRHISQTTTKSTLPPLKERIEKSVLILSKIIGFIS